MIWLIGSKGMLGTDVESKLKEKNFDFIASDREIDITDLEIVQNFIRNKEIDYIINCSAYTNVDKAESETEKAYKINADGVKNLAVTAKDINAILIHISTDYVYDGRKKSSYVETDKTNPLSVYGKSKLQGEKYIIETLEKYFIIRTAWLYGENGNNFVYTMLKLFKEKEELNIVSDQFGTPTYTNDLADIPVKIIESKNRKFGIYHFTNEGKTSWYEFAAEIYKSAKELDIIKKNIALNPITTDKYPTPATRPKFSILSKEKIKKNLNIKIRIWQEALYEFLNTIKRRDL